MKDWKEDFDKANGDYWCVCTKCKSEFRGHKRRYICKECWLKFNVNNLKEKKDKAETRRYKLRTGESLSGHFIIGMFLDLKRDWFENEGNSLFGKREKIRKHLTSMMYDGASAIEDDECTYCTGKFEHFFNTRFFMYS